MVTLKFRKKKVQYMINILRNNSIKMGIVIYEI